MHSKSAVLCVIYFSASVAAIAAQEAPLTDCDKYAASGFDLYPKKYAIPLTKLDPRTAIPACEEAVRKYPDSKRLIFQLGLSYSRGGQHGAALANFRKAGEDGYPPAQIGVGMMHAKGLGVPKDEAEAINWYRKAAEQGDIGGQIMLGLMYENGNGVRQDYSVALNWYQQAADQGSALAQDQIGIFYLKGTGIKQDGAQAVAWFRKAADQGLANSQYNLGVMYESGAGVPQDRSEALGWYKKAANQGHEQAKKKLVALETVPVDKPQFQNGPTRPKQDAVASAAVDAKIERFLDEFSCANARPGDVQVCEDLLINHIYINSRDANGRVCRSRTPSRGQASPNVCSVARRVKSAPLAGSPGPGSRKGSRRKPNSRSAVSKAVPYDLSTCSSMLSLHGG